MKLRTNYKNSIGKKFNSLTITEEWKWQSKGRRLVKCICDCGNETWALFDNITRGHTKSCGCKKAIHKGDSENELTKRFYNIYTRIIYRCNNPKSNQYYNYGGRGIKCEWETYEDFKKDMYDSYIHHLKNHGEKDTTIERINVDGNYCKDNCTWKTQEEQGWNKRNTRYVVMEDGTKKTLKEISEMYPQVKYNTLDSRYCKSKYSKTREVPICDIIKNKDIV